jgi:hypothetical protein
MAQVRTRFLFIFISLETSSIRLSGCVSKSGRLKTLRDYSKVLEERKRSRLRAMLGANKAFADRMEESEKHLATHDCNIQEIINVINRLMNPPANRRNKIGFALPPARTG